MDLKQFFERVAPRLRDAGVFDAVSFKEACVECRARGCESDARFRIEDAEDRIWVSFVTPDRWLSESVEADLEHTGDDLEELLEEELAELGLEAEVTYQHFRSEDRLFTFRTPVPLDARGGTTEAAEVAVKYLLAYEACFRELGDVAGTPEED